MVDPAHALAVHALVVATFAELGAPDSSGLVRTFLIRDGHFLGHCYRLGGLQAIWPADAAEVRFFDARGELLRSVAMEMGSARAQPQTAEPDKMSA